MSSKMSVIYCQMGAEKILYIVKREWIPSQYFSKREKHVCRWPAFNIRICGWKPNEIEIFLCCLLCANDTSTIFESILHRWQSVSFTQAASLSTQLSTLPSTPSTPSACQTDRRLLRWVTRWYSEDLCSCIWKITWCEVVDVTSRPSRLLAN